MERLTEFHNGIWGMSVQAVKDGYDKYSVFSKLAEYENTGLTPEEIKAKVELRENCFNHMKSNYEKLLKMWDSTCDGYAILWKELQAYKDAEEQGLLIKFTCKVGDKVYLIDNNEILEVELFGMMHTEFGIRCFDDTCDYFGTIGKDVFATREAAEKALKGGAPE
jgi:hypothetical protein